MWLESSPRVTFNVSQGEFQCIFIVLCYNLPYTMYAIIPLLYYIFSLSIGDDLN